MSQQRPSEFPTGLAGEDDPGRLRNPADDLLERGFIQLNTHDVSFVDEHIAGIEKFVDDLRGAINAVWPTRNNSRYSGVHVLLMSWEDDNLGVEVEIRRLGHVFSNLYRFAVDEFKIPRKTPGKATTSRITSFLEKDGEENLLVVYYAGHSRPSRLANEAPIWVANNSSKSPSLPSGGVQQLLEEAESDVLLLFDSCHSTHPAINVSGQGVTEVIAACGFETQAPSVGQHSFTNALIHELEELFTGPPFSVAELHGRIIGNLKNWKPSLLRDRQGDIWTDQDGRPRYECYKRRTPVHCFLTNETPYRSIMITPLPAELSRAAIGEMENLMSPSSESARDSSQQATSAESSDAPVSTTLTIPSESSEPIKSPQVLLAVRLEDDYFIDGDEEEDRQRVKKWCQWLRNIPNGARDIKIEGVYKSCSTLVLVSMPVTLWDGIPPNPAYSFVGFINSKNLAPSNSQETTLLTINDAIVSSPRNELPVEHNAQNIEIATESRHKAPCIDARPENPPEYHREGALSPNNDRIKNALCNNSHRDLKSSVFDIDRFLKDGYQIRLKSATDLTLEQKASIWASKMPGFTQTEKWQAPIKFTDAIGRKFILPFNLVQTWAGMEFILKRAFEHMEIIGPHVADGLYDLVTPNGDIILPSSWESVIQPGWVIRMSIWSILPPLGPEKRQNPPVRFNYVSSQLDAQPDLSMNVEYPPSPPASPQPAQGGFAQFREKIRNMNERGKEKREPRSMSRHRKPSTSGALKLHDVGGLLN